MGEIMRTKNSESLYLSEDNYSSYEEALEAGLLKALEFVK